MSIFVTSDWHFNHDREFIWKARGFSSVDEMDETIIARHNELVTPEDTVYVLGDLMLGGQSDKGIECVKRMNGHIIVIAGNHDTPARKQKYADLGFPVYDALTIKYNGYHFYLSHYPTMTANLEKEALRQCTINLYGHTHQRNNFYMGIPFMYHVGVDSHDCRPVDLDNALSEMRLEVAKCQDES